MDTIKIERPIPQNVKSVIWLKASLSSKSKPPIQISSCSAFKPFSKEKSIHVK